MASGCNVNFMAMQSLKTYKEFDRESDLGCKVYLEQFFMLKALMIFETLHDHKSNITIASSVKIRK